MRRAFRVPCDANIFRWVTDQRRIIEIKDWLRNKNDHRIIEVDLTDAEAVELMLTVEGAEPTHTSWCIDQL